MGRKTDATFGRWGDNRGGELGDGWASGPIAGTFDWGPPTAAPASTPTPQITPSLDTDGDGIANAQEFLAGTVPHDPASVLRHSQLDKSANRMQMQFLTPTGKTHRLEYTDDLASNQWHSFTEPIPGDSKLVIVEDPAAARRLQCFCRLIDTQQGDASIPSRQTRSR